MLKKARSCQNNTAIHAVGAKAATIRKRLAGMGLLGFAILGADQTRYVRDLFFMAMGLIMIIGTDFAGATPLEPGYRYHKD